MTKDLRAAAEIALAAMRDAAFDELGYTLDCDLAEAHDALRTALAQPPSAEVQRLEGATPGYALVPLEPTPQMVAAAGATPGMRAIDAASTLTQIRSGRPLSGSAFDDGAPLVQAYRAMLAAAPKPKDTL